MLSFKVPLKQILGQAYYRYELTSSDYNPNVNSTITITCKVRNILGIPISNKEITLYKNGIQVSNKTTNVGGEVS